MGAKGAFGIGGYLALNKRTAPFKNKKQKKTGEKKKSLGKCTGSSCELSHGVGAQYELHFDLNEGPDLFLLRIIRQHSICKAISEGSSSFLALEKEC